MTRTHLYEMFLDVVLLTKIMMFYVLCYFCSSSHKYLLLDSCNKGDVVFVVWSMRHSQYMVVQDSPILYFVHGDCLSAMNLRMPATPSPSENAIVENTLLPVPYYAIGRVIDREYCQARKVSDFI